MLDSFTRNNGTMGSGWGGSTSGYRIASNQLDVNSGGAIFWRSTRFEANQEAYVTLNTIDASARELDLILKAQSNTDWTSGVLEVWYNPKCDQVTVWTYSKAQGWRQRGAAIPVKFVAGDRLGAGVSATGYVQVYQNDRLLATRDASAWTYAKATGYIGLWTIDANAAVLDNFGGGTILP